MPAPDDVAIRPAEAQDLAEVRVVWLEAALAGFGETPPLRPFPSAFRHVFEHGRMWVAERDGRVVGVSAARERGGAVFLAELFVRPDCQSGGVGARLLAAAAPPEGRSFWTVASGDARAHALYLRAGMRPVGPRYALRAGSGALRLPSARGLRAAPAAPDDADFRRRRAALAGAFDDADHAHLVRDRGAVPLWLVRRRERVGFAYVQTRDDEGFWHADAATVGPLGVDAAGDAAAGAVAACVWARKRAKVVQISVPGRFPGLAPLLAAGFRIVDVETVFATTRPPTGAAARHLF